MNRETGTTFESRRGISEVEAKSGIAQVAVGAIAGDLALGRLRVLAAVSEAGISIDFLKLTHQGLAFTVNEGTANDVSNALAKLDIPFEIRPGRCIVLAKGANMRDEAGLIARIVQAAIEAGSKLDHIGDMHDRVLLVVDAVQAEAVVARIRQMFAEGLS